MARKKYCDENRDSDRNYEKSHCRNDTQVTYHNSHQFNLGGQLVGGGTKKHLKSSDDYSNSKNSDYSYDGAVLSQLSNLGLSIREMPGDGNCLFRALSDQISGTSRNHLEYRRGVVQYMKDYRGDFEPFVEDDVPFEKYLQRLSQPGTFAGNDAIVAFARMHNVSVVIHQLNSPAWVIHPSKDSQLPVHGGREVHIFYHNGDHYNSVRRIGDDTDTPTSIQLHSHASASLPSFFKPSGKKSPPQSASGISSAYAYYDKKRDEDYWVKDSGDVDKLVEDVIQQTNYPDPTFVRETLIDYNFDMVATIDFIINTSVQLNQQNCPSETKSDNLEHSIHSPKSNDQSEVSNYVLEDNSKNKNDISLVCNSNLNSDTQKQIKISETPRTDTEHECPGPTDASEAYVPQESSPSQESNIEISCKKESRIRNRRKKELKKRERKREADKKKISAKNTGNVAEKENTVFIPSLGSLDI